VLRYSLAIDRTRLANERTLLSYIRTAIAVLASGLGLVYLFDAKGVHVMGWALVVLACGFVGWGVRRYRAVNRDLREAAHDQSPDL
jgi:putative membrane protein